jgi:septum formation protein
LQAMRKEIILASASPRRKELLALLGIAFTVMPSSVNEDIDDSQLSPAQVVEVLAERKARYIATKLTSGLVIGSDTIVVVDEQILGKPQDAQDAYQMLTLLQSRTHSVYSGLTVVDAASPEPQVIVGHNVSKVTFRPMSHKEIEGYINTGEPLDKAGSYGVQGLGSVFIERIEGDFYSVMGLPLNLLYQMLLEFGISPFKVQ